MYKAKPTHEFRVGISGIRLPEGASTRISRAVQKAVLTELAGLDLKVGLDVRFLGNDTQGMEVVATTKGRSV